MKSATSIKEFSLFLIFFLLLTTFAELSEAAVTLAWNPPAKNEDGSSCSDLNAYKVYYDTDGQGAPYQGKGLTQGNSPILVPVSSLQDSSHPEMTLSGFGMDGIYHITLTAIDMAGNESHYSNELLVIGKEAQDNVPIVDSGPDQIITQAQIAKGSQQVTLNGNRSKSPNGKPLSYSWKQTKGSPVSLMGGKTEKPFFAVTSSHAGQRLEFQLVVHDGVLESNPDTMSIMVEGIPSAGNDSPTAIINAAPTEGKASLTVSFFGTGSDSDGTITNYFWIFGDGSSSTKQNPRHTYTSPGYYYAILGVMDNQGSMNISGIHINVTTSDMNTSSYAGISNTSGLSQDADDDGIDDSLETSHGLNIHSMDSDGDGIPDRIEWGLGEKPLDSDGDGTIDVLDLDSDNDSKPDSQEGMGDEDNDGAYNYIDIDDSDGPLADQDNDGINNSTEVTFGLNPNLTDSDNDGIEDKTEFGSLPWPLDSDGDQIIDAMDEDSDNDGTPDSQEGNGDNDADGAPDFIDALDTDGPNGDQDQDGFSNLDETSSGLNPNLSDSDHDGISDADEVGDIHHPTDTDDDGIIDAQDKDADNDGIQDQEESEYDMDGDNLPDRLDRSIAAFQGKKERMALKIVTEGCYLSNTKSIQNSLSTNAWGAPPEPFQHGGLQFVVQNVPVMESVQVQILLTRNFHQGATYWKYDQHVGYYDLESQVSGKSLTFTLTDGGMGDADNTVNGVIVDPGFISESESQSVSSSFHAGGSGCTIGNQLFSLPDLLSLLFPILLLGIIKRVRRA